MVTDQGTYASLPSSRVMSMDGGNANFQISGGGKYQVRWELVRLIDVEKKGLILRGKLIAPTQFLQYQ